MVSELFFQTRPTYLVVLGLADSPLLLRVVNSSPEKSAISSLLPLVKTKQVERTLASNLNSVSK